tara:strand:+ start:227 stop:499 length:273 start_codon:yes stop_codon:yes gene_type:complete
MSSTNANAFHILCKMMGAKIFFDRRYTTHMSIPKNVNGINRSMLKCASAKISELSKMETSIRKYLVNDGRRKPRKIISSHTGATNETTAT